MSTDRDLIGIHPKSFPGIGKNWEYHRNCMSTDGDSIGIQPKSFAGIGKY